MAYYTALGWRAPGLGSTTVAGSNSVQAIATAISKAEGFGASPTNIPTSHNNPGDLKDASGQIISYATPQQGWDALYNQINLMITGQSKYYDPSMTWTQIAQTYSPSGASNWLNNVTTTLGVDPNSTLNDYLSGGGAVLASGGTDTSGTDTSATDSSLTTPDWTTWLIVGAVGLIAIMMLSSSPQRSYA